jgi:putative addiction module CopG family antidote
MNISLTQAHQSFVDKQVESGRYLDASDVVRTALRRMEAQESAATFQAEFQNLSAGDGDIMALAFIVIMEAAKSAREDLKTIMDGVKAINKEKEGWRSVVNTVNTFAAAGAGKGDNFKASELGKAIPRGSARKIANEPIGAGTLDDNNLVFNTPDANGATVPGGLKIAGTGQPDGFVSKKDIDTAKEVVKNKLDSLSEMGEMESLRLQMAMDRYSKLMSTLSNLLKKASETSSTIVQNLK